MIRSRTFWRAAGVAALRATALALAAAAPAFGETLAVSFAPDLPTWHDEITMTAKGTTVTPPCSASLRVTQIDPYQRLIKVVAAEECPPQQPPLPPGVPFTASVSLGHLEPGPWTVLLSGLTASQSQVLEVHGVGGIDVDFPEPVTAGVPFDVRVRGIADCAAAFAGAQVEVTPGVITITAGSPCVQVTQPPGGPFDLVAQVPALAPGLYDVRLYDVTSGGTIPPVQRRQLRVWDAAGCLPSDTALCLQGGRFRVEATWRDFAGREGVAHAQPLAGDDGSGLFWFFSPDNAELTVKMLDGCALNQRWWVFLAASSTVAYEVVVTDTDTGHVQRYRNALGATPRLVPDTAAFAGCGGS